MKTENLITYAKETGVKAIADQMTKLAPTLEALTRQNDFLIAENARLRQEREQLKDSNSKLNRENADFKSVAKQMRELNLDQVLIKMYGATESTKSKPHHKTRAFMLPDGLTIEYTGNQWQSQDGQTKGKGAINLVMHLSGYGQDYYQQAVRDLAETFGDKDIINTLATYLAETASREAHNIVHQKYQMPQPCRRTWQTVRAHLIDKMKLPGAFVDQAHDDGLIFSDQRYNCVFPRADDSGVFKIGTGDKFFRQSLGKDGNPFVITGTDDKVYITDSPLEALSLKLLRPDSTILATGDFMQAEKLKPYLDQKEILLAQGQDRNGNAMAQYLREHFPKAKRIRPNMGNSWNKCRLLQIEEDKAKKAQAQSSRLAAATEISRSSGWSR